MSIRTKWWVDHIIGTLHVEVEWVEKCANEWKQLEWAGYDVFASHYESPVLLSCKVGLIMAIQNINCSGN